MMTRKRALLTRLVLINFNGFPFVDLELDALLTSLEGTNGAGKTTAMIAAYLPLMPDRDFLQFRNISDNADQVRGGGALFDRFGVFSDIAYSVLQVRLADGTTVAIGVEIQKRPGKKYELTPFILRDLPSGLAMQDLLMIDDGQGQHAIAPLAQLVTHVVLQGAKIQKYPNRLGDYFAALFELGIAPVILTTHADRAKFHKLMMASFYGGLTNDLQRGIKEYLLPENNEIATSVARAKELLAEVRITRHQIDLAQEVYAKIQKVDEAAFDMVASAYFYISLQFEYRRSQSVLLRQEYHASKNAYRSLRHELDTLGRDQAELEVGRENARKNETAARDRHAQHQAAHALATKIDGRCAESAQLKAAYDAAAAVLRDTGTALEDARRRYSVAFAERDTLARALGDEGKAFQEISRMAGLYRAACAALDQVRALLSRPGLTPYEAADLHESTACDITALRVALAPKQRDVQNAVDQRRAFLDIAARLKRVTGEDVAHEEAYWRGAATLTAFRDKEAAVREADGLGDRIRQARHHAAQQRQGQTLIAGLARHRLSIATAEALHQGIEDNTRQREIQDGIIEHEVGLVADLNDRLRELGQQEAALRAALASWSASDALRCDLEEARGKPFADAGAVQAEQGQLEATRAEAVARRDALRAEVAELEQRIAELHEHGSSPGAHFSRAADLVGGRLMAEVYDEVGIEEAARIEARLGPLAEAILVPQIARAADTLGRQPETGGPGYWLVTEDALSSLPEGETYGALCAVEFGCATRLSRRPERPVIGRAARQAEIARLQDMLATRMEERDSARQALEELEAQSRLVRDLLNSADLIGTPSPEPAYQRTVEELRAKEQARADAQHRMRAAQHTVGELRAVRRDLDACAPYAPFLGGEDWAIVTAALERQLSEASQIRRELEKHHEDVAALREGLETLRAVPLAPGQLAVLQNEVHGLDARIRVGNESLALLAEVLRVRDHFRYAEQVPLEAQKKGALSALQQQVDDLTAAVDEAHQDVRETEAARELAQQAHSNAYAAHSALATQIAAMESELAAMAVASDGESLALAKEEWDRADAQLKAIGERYDNLMLRIGGKRSEVATSKDALMGRQGDNALLRAQQAVREKVRLAVEWREIERLVKDRYPALLSRLYGPGTMEHYHRKGWVTLNATLPELRAALLGALNEAGAPSVLRTAGGTRPRDYVADWTQVRLYLEQSLPRDLTQAADIGQALRDITSALARMQARQQEQEMKFRTSAESISNSIQNLVRREINLINRINSDRKLAEVRFGSITGIRIDAKRDERMGLFLDALKTEDDLFADDKTLEAALDQLYAKTVGGSANGAQLLDYRRYIVVRIQIRRLDAAGWDSNLGTSSGEAIGVGAAILGVILDAMERQSEALQRRKVKGSIRFLMLDEANRLHSDAMEVMAKFCENMGVQLLVAAPEIDKARTGTTFRLVRRRTGGGQQVEVTTRGRRGFEAAAPA